MTSKIISITIEQMDDGWHVVAYIDDRMVEASPALSSRTKARREAQQVAKRFKAKFARVAIGAT